MIAIVSYFTLLLFILGIILYSIRTKINKYSEDTENFIYNYEDAIPIEWEVIKEHNVPLITLTFPNSGKFTFLVDSGASHNYIDNEAFTNFKDVTPVEGAHTYYGASGEEKQTNEYSLFFTYRNSHFEDNFLVADLSGLNKLSAEVKTNIVGVIGVSFLKKYGLSIDLNRMIVWKGI